MYLYLFLYYSEYFIVSLGKDQTLLHHYYICLLGIFHLDSQEQESCGLSVDYMALYPRKYNSLLCKEFV
jgi:hypothetical protein